jgi:hypothetical protein
LIFFDREGEREGEEARKKGERREKRERNLQMQADKRLGHRGMFHSRETIFYY